MLRLFGYDMDNAPSLDNTDNEVIAAVRCWVETFVIGMNLCPFAKRELVKDRIRFVVTAAVTEAHLLQVLQAELELLNTDAAIETTLLIHPQVLQDFYTYNNFLNVADALLVSLELEGVYQIASFHPDYQFGGTEQDDVENYTNRAPYPVLHILRESSIEQVIASYPSVDDIPERNIALMNALGRKYLQTVFKACLNRSA